MKVSNVALGGLLCAVLGALPLGATSIGAGSFNLTGTVYVTPGGIQFFYNTLGDTTALVQTPSSGVFAGVDKPTPQFAKVNNLPAVPGATSVAPWIVLNDGISLNATDIPSQTPPYTPCTLTAADDAIVGGCTVPGDTAILLAKTTTGVNVTVSVSGDAYSGTASTGTTHFNGILTTQFAQMSPSIFALEQLFAAQGFIENSFSGNFVTATTSTVPEPGTLASLGFGMLCVGLVGRRKFQKRAQ